MMKKNFVAMNAFLIIIIVIFGFSGCQQPEIATDLWADALYSEDTELGNGQKTVQVEVKAEDKSITFTIHSDKKTLGEALLEHKLIEGEQGAYGLYVKKVNGILADYDINKSYWGFNKNGESMRTGVDGVSFNNGEHYELIYTK